MPPIPQRPKVSPGEFVTITSINMVREVDGAEQIVTLEESPADSTRVFADDLSVVQLFPNTVSHARLQLGHELGLMAGQALTISPLTKDMGIRIPAGGNIRRPGREKSSFLEQYGRSAAVVMARLPGETPTAQTSDYIGSLATAVAVTHNQFVHPWLLEYTPWKSQQLHGVKDYTDRFLKPAADRSVYEMKMPLNSLNVIDQYWSRLPHGLVHTNMSANNTLVDSEGRLTGMTGFFHRTQFAPRLFAAARAAWGVWANTQDMDAVSQFVRQYEGSLQADNPQMAMTRLEHDLWPHMIVVRGITNWHEKQLLGPEVAQKQKALMAKFIADNISYFRQALPRSGQ